MSIKKRWQFILSSLIRHRKHFMLSSIGIVTGIMAFSFFWALSAGVSQVVLGEIFPVKTLEVVPRSLGVNVGPIQLGLGADALTQKSVTAIQAVPNVTKVYTKMKVTTPMVGVGGKKYLGNDLQIEILAEGIDPGLVAGDVDSQFKFEATPVSAPLQSCKTDLQCGDNGYCYDAPNLSWRYQNLNPGFAYCRHYIPVLASQHLVEIFNGVVRRAHDFPKLNPQFVIGYDWDIILGSSVVRRSEASKKYHYKVRLVGFSDQAMWLGLTFPLPVVQKFNTLFHGAEAAQTFHSVTVKVDRKDQIAAVSQKIEQLGFDIKDSGAARASFIILVTTLVFLVISLIIVGVAAVNIMHVYFMLIYERQVEIGLMRALGAKRSDIRWVILGEAGLVGIMSGIVGVVLALLSSQVIDYISRYYVPDFPYKPSSYFVFDAGVVVTAVLLSVGFCMLGAYFPASRAAKVDPARVLTGQ